MEMKQRALQKQVTKKKSVKVVMKHTTSRKRISITAWTPIR